METVKQFHKDHNLHSISSKHSNATIKKDIRTCHFGRAQEITSI